MALSGTNHSKPGLLPCNKGGKALRLCKSGLAGRKIGLSCYARFPRVLQEGIVSCPTTARTLPSYS